MSRIYLHHPESDCVFYIDENSQWSLEELVQQGCNIITESDYKKFKVHETSVKMLEKFGCDSQLDVMIEEMSELTKEIIKYKRSKIHSTEVYNRSHMVEELSDVLFMAETLKTEFDISDKEIQDIICAKAERTAERYLKKE